MLRMGWLGVKFIIETKDIKLSKKNNKTVVFKKTEIFRCFGAGKSPILSLNMPSQRNKLEGNRGEIILRLKFSMTFSF